MDLHKFVSIGIFLYNQIMNKGFTLIELIIVISILAVLSIIGITSYNRAQDNSKIAKAKADLEAIRDAIMIARITSDKALIDITGSFCSEYPCRTAGDLRKLPSNHSCITNWQSFRTKISALNGDILAFDTDPWGSPYLIDENEKEYAHCRGRSESIASAGPNGVLDDIAKNGNTDDIIVWLKPYHNYPASHIPPACNQ